MMNPRMIIICWLVLGSGSGRGRGEEAPSSLDAMNCLVTSTYQFSQIGDRARRITYDFSEPLRLLFAVLFQLREFKFGNYEGKEGFIQTQNYLTGNLFGTPIEWTSLQKSTVKAIPNTHQAVIDLYRIVTDPTSFSGLCLKGRVLTTYSLCRSSLRVSAGLIPISTPADPDQSNVNRVEVLLMSSSALEFDTPDNIKTENSKFYIFRVDQPAALVFNLTRMVNNQIFEILTQLQPFSQHIKGQERCNYFILQALCGAIFSKQCEHIEGENLKKIQAECVIYTELWKNQRSERSLFSWMFTDQSATILALIKSQHQGVKADKVLATNDLILQRRVSALAKNLELLRNVTGDNFDTVQRILSKVEARRTLMHVESVLRDNKLAILSSLGDLNSLVVNVRTQSNQMLQSLFSELTDDTHCVSDRVTSRIACSDRPGYVETIKHGIIQVNSPGKAYELKNLLIYNCLFLHSTLFSYPTLFRGNRRRFLASEEFNYSKNLTCPRPCFQDIKSKAYNCQKCLTDELNTVLLPLYSESFYFVINGDFVYLQSISGLVRVVNNKNKEVNIGLRPHLISRSDFPLQTSDKVIQFSDLQSNENSSALSGFFLHEYTSSYFSEFDFSSARLGAQGFVKTQWDDTHQEIKDLFDQSYVFRVLSVSGLTCLGLGLLILIFCLYCCFRRRKGQTKLINRVYSTVRSREEESRGPPALKRKPPSDQVGKTNRNHALGPIVNALKRNNKKLARQMSEEEISLSPL